MFDRPDLCFWQEAFQQWRTRAAQEGYAIDTDDVCGPAEADCLWFLSLPRRRETLIRYRAAAGAQARTVLQVMESPLIDPLALVPANQREFDAVLSYVPEGDPPRLRTHRYAVSLTPRIFAERLFSERRVVVMVNGNHYAGWFAKRLPGWVGLPVVGPLFSGWRVRWRQLLRPGFCELYSWRRRLARQAERRLNCPLDIYGAGWKGDRSSWFPGVSRRPYRAAVEAPRARDEQIHKLDAKFELMADYRFAIATENYRGSKRYISEKVFDVLRAGVVPVYLGDERIEAEVPAEAFVDVRKFADEAALLDYLEACGEAEWRAMRDAGREFLGSSAATCFGQDNLATAALGLLREIVPVN